MTEVKKGYEIGYRWESGNKLVQLGEDQLHESLKGED